MAAKFKVLESKNGAYDVESDTHRFELAVALLQGELTKDLDFWAFDTDRAFPVCVLAVRADAQRFILDCLARGSPHYEGLFDGAVIDTSGRRRGVHFFYDSDDQQA